MKNIIRATVNGILLTYTGEIISQDDIFLVFIDKFGNKISLNKKNIDSIEEVKQ